jgi:hypothetical protein
MQETQLVHHHVDNYGNPALKTCLIDFVIILWHGFARDARKATIPPSGCGTNDPNWIAAINAFDVLLIGPQCIL